MSKTIAQETYGAFGRLEAIQWWRFIGYVCAGGGGASILSVFLLWMYLRQIGQPELLLKSLADPTGAGLLLAGTAVALLLGLFLLTCPSFFLACMSHGIRSDIGELAARTLPRALGWLAFGVFMVIPLMLAGAGAWSVLLGPLLGIVCHFAWLRSKAPGHVSAMFKSYGDSKSAITLRAFGYVFVILFGGIMTVWPMSMVMMAAKFDSDAMFATLFAGGLITLQALASLLPGALYCYGNTKRLPLPRLVAVYLLVSVLVVWVFALIVPHWLSRAMERAAVEVGLRVETPYRYLVTTEKMGRAMFRESQWNAIEQDGFITVEGIVPLNIGDLVLLCPSRLNTTEKLRMHSAQCTPLGRSEIRRLPQAISNSVEEGG